MPSTISSAQSVKNAIQNSGKGVFPIDISIYLRFKRGKVARTFHRGETGTFVDAPNTDFSRLNYRPASLVPA